MERYLRLTRYVEDDTAVRSISASSEVRISKLPGAKAALIQVASGNGLYVRVGYDSDPTECNAGCRKITSEAWILLDDNPNQQARLRLLSVDLTAVDYRIIWAA